MYLNLPLNYSKWNSMAQLFRLWWFCLFKQTYLAALLASRLCDKSKRKSKLSSHSAVASNVMCFLLQDLSLFLVWVAVTLSELDSSLFSSVHKQKYLFIYFNFHSRHPLFPLLALLFEKCEQSTQGSEGTTSASFDVDIENFVRKQEKEGKPFFCEDPETDNLVSVNCSF